MTRRLDMLMLAIIIVGVAHMGEQLVTSIEEFYVVRDAFGGWYGLFPADHADHASVLLITIMFTAISLVFYALMRGGIAPLIVAGVFGVLGIAEGHHWISALEKGSYEPGLLSSFAYVGVGLLLVIEVVREARARRVAGAPAAVI
jgi:hypothetical protein